MFLPVRQRLLLQSCFVFLDIIFTPVLHLFVIGERAKDDLSKRFTVRRQPKISTNLPATDPSVVASDLDIVGDRMGSPCVFLPSAPRRRSIHHEDMARSSLEDLPCKFHTRLWYCRRWSSRRWLIVNPESQHLGLPAVSDDAGVSDRCRKLIPKVCTIVPLEQQMSRWTRVRELARKPKSVLRNVEGM